MEADIQTSERKKILIADDEQDLREALFTIFAASGFEVLVAADGEEAVEKALAEKPDLLLLDLMMPKMTGQEVLDRLRDDEVGKDIKILILTAVSDLESLSAILERGGYDYLVKSDWKLEDIVGKVREKLAE